MSQDADDGPRIIGDQAERRCAMNQSFLSFFPILQWLPQYAWQKNLLSDVLGGLTVGVMHVPQGIAYAHLAGVDPVLGLYISFFPPLLYMIFGTSRHTSIGSFAVVSLMSGIACRKLLASRGITPPDHAASLNNDTNTNGDDGLITMNEAASALTVTVGIVQLMMALLHLKFIATYFSDQLISGFTTAASLHVMIGQFREIFAIPGLKRRTGAGYLILVVYDLIWKASHANLFNIIIAGCAILFLMITKDYLNPYVNRKFKLKATIPCELILVIVATISSYLFHFRSRFDVKTVGHIPIGLPVPTVPRVELIPELIVDAVGIAVVVMAVHISLAKMFAKKMQYRIDTGQEFYAVGLASVISGMFPVYPVSCSLGRTMVNVDAGTKTQLSSFFSSALIFVLILRLGPLLETLPRAILAAIVIVSLKGMMKKFADLPKLWPLSKIDFAIWVVSFTATVAVDVMNGLAISICFALLTTVFRTQWPRWHFLANLEATNDFRDAERYLDVRFDQGICIYRFDAPLLFTNVERLKSTVHKAVSIWKFKPLSDEVGIGNGDAPKKYAKLPIRRTSSLGTISVYPPQRKSVVPVRKSRSSVNLETPEKWLTRASSHFIIDCSGFTYVDYMGVNALKEIFAEMRSNNVLVYFAATKAPVRDLFEASGFYRYVPKSNFYPTICDAVMIAKHRQQTWHAATVSADAKEQHDRLADVIRSHPLY